MLKEGEGKKVERNLVQAGNQAAHDGNIAADSVLFSMGLVGMPKESNLEDVFSSFMGVIQSMQEINILHRS